jgi:hypothetical protein
MILWKAARAASPRSLKAFVLASRGFFREALKAAKCLSNLSKLFKGKNSQIDVGFTVKTRDIGSTQFREREILWCPTHRKEASGQDKCSCEVVFLENTASGPGFEDFTKLLNLGGVN